MFFLRTILGKDRKKLNVKIGHLYFTCKFIKHFFTGKFQIFYRVTLNQVV